MTFSKKVTSYEYLNLRYHHILQELYSVLEEVAIVVVPGMRLAVRAEIVIIADGALVANAGDVRRIRLLGAEWAIAVDAVVANQ